MKKYVLTFLGFIFILVFISGCNTTTKSSESQSNKKLNLEESNELITTSETSISSDSLQSNSSNNISEIQESSFDLNNQTETSATENEFEINAKNFPADSVATFEGAKFSGMKYLYSGKVLAKVTANSVSNLISTSYLVENDRGYRMLVTPPYEVEIPDGVTLEVKGTLNGNVYDLESASLSGINKKAGLINGSTIIINGKTLGIDYFSPNDL